jgi:hypothetical protein
MGMRWYAAQVDATGAERLRELAAEGALEDPFSEDLVHGELIDIDKAWHGITRLLTGTAWEVRPGAGAAILGGEPLFEEDQTAALLSPEEVREISRDLDALDLAEVAARYDARAFTADGIYPEIWDRPDEQDIVEAYLLPHLEAVIAFYRSAARAGRGVVTLIG